MRNTSLVLLGLAVAAGAGGAARAAPASDAGFNAPGDVKAITAIETALATQTDMKALIGYYAPKAVVEDVGANYKGRKEIEKGFGDQLAAVKTMQANIVNISVASDGTLACAAVRASFDTVLKDGSKLVMTTRQLDGFRKIHGQWQVEQEQISLPMDAKTGMAVMNGSVPAAGAMPWTADVVAGPPTTVAKAKDEIHTWLVTGAPVVDVNEMMTYLAPNDQILLYDLTAPGEYRTADAVKADYAPLMNSLSSAKDQLFNFVVDSDGKFAIQIDNQNLQINFKAGNSKIISFRQSDCLGRVGGKWQSFAEMLSFPADMKTGKSISSDPSAKF